MRKPVFFPILYWLLASILIGAETYVHSILGTSAVWAATRWTPDDIVLFGGMPAYTGPDRHIILVRYSFYVSAYDVDKLAPLWVAHVDEQDSELKDNARKGVTWDRGTDVFRPDENVVLFSNAFGGPIVTNKTYTNANPLDLPVGERGYAKITRGHMASNQEMKSLGTDAEGEISQTESFSFANVAPQMQHHNSPLWATLETDCLKWAGKLGRVAVISGPVFSPDTTLPVPSNDIIYSVEKDGVRMPIPTHFFKVIIGKIDGRIAVVAFLIPHQVNIEAGALARYVVPVRQIENITKLNFMPKLGRNNTLERTTDGRWLPLLR
jgi:DNA/RNA endonuclease G (NUC1)